MRKETVRTGEKSRAKECKTQYITSTSNEVARKRKRK